MVAERFFTKDLLEKGKRIVLKEQEFLHLTKVMRTKPGDIVELVNGLGELAKASVEAIRKKEVELLVIDFFSSVQTPFCILAQALPRLNRLDFILEKGTELGMDELWLFPGDLSERKDLTEQQQKRLYSIAISAMKQSGRLFLPKILIKPPLKKWNKPELPFYFGDISPSAPPFGEVLKISPFIFAVGPEKGFSDQETAYLKDLSALGVKLHSNILRTDTASLAALTVASHHFLIDQN